jgi:hypothetical protein
MSVTDTASFRDCMKSVDDQIEAGCSFGQVEDFINARSIDEEHKAALWLWAWAHQVPEAKHSLADSDRVARSKRNATEAGARLAEFSSKARGAT